MDTQLLVSASANFIPGYDYDITGAAIGTVTARVQIGPAKQRDTWIIERLTSVVSPYYVNASPSTLKVYRNAESPSTYIDGSYDANNDVSQMTPPLILGAGEKLIFVWHGGSGNIATVTITGLLRTGT